MYTIYTQQPALQSTCLSKPLSEYSLFIKFYAGDRYHKYHLSLPSVIYFMLKSYKLNGYSTIVVHT